MIKLKKNRVNIKVPILNEDIIKKSVPKYLDFLKIDYLKEIVIKYEKFEHLYLMPFLMIIKIMKRLNIMFRLYNKREFSLKFYLNGISIVLGIVYILYIDYPIFLGRITGNQIGMVSALLSFGCSISADIISGKAPNMF